MSAEISKYEKIVELLMSENNTLKAALLESERRLDNGMTMRDHFAGLAMQSLYLSGVEWETTGKERDEGSLAAIKELACDAYQLADAMLEAREVGL